jgi:hypothetical protein
MKYDGYDLLVEKMSLQSLNPQEFNDIKLLITNDLTLHNLIDVFFKFEDRLRVHGFLIILCYTIINSNRTRLLKVHTLYKTIHKEIQLAIILHLDNL